MEPTKDDATSPMSRITDDSQYTNTRRSSRARKAPAKYDETYVIPNAKPNAKVPSQPTTKQDRPKRKAAQAATQNIIPEDAGPILEDVLSQMSPDEREEYDGWAELESDPGFFGAMLVELGAKEYTIQEIYSLGPETWKELPQPVYGLIFLFEYEGDDDNNNTDNRPDCPGYLWFANQTTANACATVALMNILMNPPSNFGGYLNAFRSQTGAIPPPHRGHRLDRDTYIRSVHNSLARRIDLIAEDLALDNKYEESQKKRKAQKRTARPKRKKPNADINYHYIAYVPMGGQVWELDGLQTNPLSLGRTPKSKEGWWLDVAGEAIQERMMRNSEYSSYNLLAICQSPLKERTREFGQSLYFSLALHKRDFGGNPSDRVPDPFGPDPDAKRLDYSRSGVDRSFGPRRSFKETINDPGFDNTKALALAKKLESERDALEALIVAEQEAINEMMERYRSRKRDYTPAIHQWVRTLAEKGVLRELIQEIDRES